MADLAFIAPEKTTTVTFDLEPAYNALHSLMLLDQQLSGFGEWVHHTAAEMSEEDHWINKIVVAAAAVYFEDTSWPHFLAWLDYLETLDPVEMRDRELEALLKSAVHYLQDDSVALPDPEELLQDRERYLSFIEEVMSCKDHPLDRARYDREYDLLTDPPARKELILSHLRKMWEEILSKEWEQNHHMLRECVAAFKSLDLFGMSTDQTLRMVFDREVPEEWEDKLEGLDKIILIPSPHIGPYLLMISHNESTARIIFGARTPSGASVQSPELSRSEIVARMSALANDTRLNILHLLSQEGELGSQEIINRLDLSQSAASRHLQHLKVTGYIVERRREGGKFFRLNPDRINDMFQSLQEFLQ